MKSLPFAPFAPCPKLGQDRSSFGSQGAFVKSFPPCFCPSRPLCPRRDRLRVSRMPDQDPSWYSPLSDSGRVCYQSTNPCAKVPMYPCSCQGVMRAGQPCESLTVSATPPTTPSVVIPAQSGIQGKGEVQPKLVLSKIRLPCTVSGPSDKNLVRTGMLVGHRY